MSAVSPVAREQAIALFEEIATSACTVDDICREVHDSISRDDLIAAVQHCRELTARMGWMADLGLEKLGQAGQIRGGAEEWLMPPSYHAIAEHARRQPTSPGEAP